MDEKQVCQNCGRAWDAGDLKIIEDFFDRVNTGEIVPSGECPECGYLCHPETAGTVVVGVVDGKVTGAVSTVPGLTVAFTDQDLPDGLESFICILKENEQLEI